MADEHKIAALESTLVRLVQDFELLRTRVVELEMFRDTGMKHKRCPTCNQLVPMTAYDFFMPHTIRSVEPDVIVDRECPKGGKKLGG